MKTLPTNSIRKERRRIIIIKEKEVIKKRLKRDDTYMIKIKDSKN